MITPSTSRLEDSCCDVAMQDLTPPIRRRTVKARKLDPGEPFIIDADKREPIGATVGEFWQWAFSDLAANTTRGVLAEFLVGKALGLSMNVPRGPWDDFDLLTSGGVRVEVKATGLVQSWQSRGSAPGFSGLRGRTLTSNGASYDGKPLVRADVFVFCFDSTASSEVFEPTNLSSWEFYVVPAKVIDATGQKSMRLSRVRELTKRVSFKDVSAAVMEAANASA